MGLFVLLILFLVWAVSTIKTESENIDRYNALGYENKARESAERGATAIVYLGIFIVLALVALVS